MSRSLISELIHEAVLAPSAMNFQPWAFGVILDRSFIRRLGERAKEWLMTHEAALDLGEMAHEILARPGFTIFYDAPALVMVLATAAGSQASEDCCLAAQSLMLAARNRGLGSCWIGFARPWFDLPETKRELGIEDAHHVVAPIILGYPQAWPESHGRKPAEIHWIQSAR